MTLTGAQIESAGLDDWRLLLRSLHGRFRTGSFATGLRLVNEIGAVAEEMNHHPDLDLRYGHLDVRLTSHDSGGVTDRDVRLAREISRCAAAAGVVADPATVSTWELALDARDRTRVLPFWRSVLGYDDPATDAREVVDPGASLPALWFQDTDSLEPDRQRFHVDVIVAPEQVQPRMAAAVAAGGSLVTSDHAPAFWVLADPEGNLACLCTWQGRDQ